MELRSRNNLILIFSAFLILVFLILSTLKRGQEEVPIINDFSSADTARSDLLSLAVESILSERGAIDSLVPDDVDRDPKSLSPAESLLIGDLARSQGLSPDSVRRVYIDVRASLLTAKPF